MKGVTNMKKQLRLKRQLKIKQRMNIAKVTLFAVIPFCNSLCKLNSPPFIITFSVAEIAHGGNSS